MKTISQQSGKRCCADHIRIVLIIGTTAFCSSLDAAEWIVDGTVNQSLSYNDNVRMLPENAEGSVVYNLTPTLNFARMTEVWDIQGRASYGVQHYTDIEELDQNPQDYGLSTVYRTERSNTGLSASYSIVPSQNFAEQDTGNFATNAKRNNLTVTPTYSYRFTELDSLISSASYSKSTYSNPGSGNNDTIINNFNDNEVKSINVGWQRQWSELFAQSISVFYSNYNSTGRINSESNSYGINLTSSYQLSEEWQFSGTIGGRITDTSIDTVIIPGLLTAINQNTSEGFLTDIGVHYKGENLSSNFGLSRSLVPSGQGQLTEQTRVSLDFSYRITERLSSGLTASYQETDSVSDINGGLGQSRTNTWVSPNINWELTQDWLLSASYAYRNQDRKNPDRTADSNIFMLTINYNWPGLSISR
ncbi:hypothetical protein [Methylobacter sp. YRD-M1]|uniref:hypothetical protein n=1 Tax=Methylobacter sp. YRD-M1 TaxID=2911520 RepID=UPI00227AB9DA|nr:hypothetical protein [Methylobacter sp. YRD-M1]WAK01150.1 hypothetical protein LZ558_15090 [Methylobacter sp. YRD-M1]